jgi:CheY-like chemotaxis protein/anti-sigma regulatory factor (Ser/Thr protein kinase)
MEELEKDGLNREALLDAERAARLEAQRAAHMKDEFLATVSHELRTPLHAILGWAQVFQVPGLVKPDEIARGVDAIQRNARAQVRLIDDLLDLSRIMGGRVRLDLQRLMLHAVVEAALDSAQPAAMVKGIQIEHVLDPVAGAVSGDAARLQQVVWNLLSNAIKFTPNGGRVQVTLERVNSNIELTVSDTGIGIAPEFVPMLFDRFSQQDTSIRRTYGGLGLGLAIAKHLVELHGGTLRAKSEGQGRGSSFTVSLPVAIMLPSPPLAAHAHAPLPALEGVRTLVVDDDRDALELATRLLEAQGAIVTAVASGEAAIASLDRADQDVLISDVSMPNVDGYQLIGRIRSSEAPYSRLPAVALTAFARAEDRKRALLAGYDSHLSKPVDIGELVMEVAALTNRTQKAAPLT